MAGIPGGNAAMLYFTDTIKYEERLGITHLRQKSKDCQQRNNRLPLIFYFRGGEKKSKFKMHENTPLNACCVSDFF